MRKYRVLSFKLNPKLEDEESFDFKSDQFKNVL